jgi:MoxR-like ATPase
MQETIAPKPTILTSEPVQDMRSIHSNLVGKEEVFRMLALAEACSLPLLLIGDPGTAKTRAILDYAKSYALRGINPVDRPAIENAMRGFNKSVFILETDEGTNQSAVKGTIDLEKLLTENKFQHLAPITEAEVIVINEIDKGSSEIRNALLGVMNERFLFNGKDKIPCKWKLFVAAVNEIPADESDGKNPFWDRFVLKYNVERLNEDVMEKYLLNGDRSNRNHFILGVPNKTEVNQKLQKDHLKAFLKVGYDHCSDRTLTYTPTLIRNIAKIWSCSMRDAVVKTTEIMINKEAATQIVDDLYSASMKKLMQMAEMIYTFKTQEELNLEFTKIGDEIQKLKFSNSITEEEVDEIALYVSKIADEMASKLQVGVNHVPDQFTV